MIDPAAMKLYRDGKALDIHGAALKIDGAQWYADVEEGADRVTFTVELKQGPHTLRAWFSGGNNVHHDTVLSPYYVSIRWV